METLLVNAGTMAHMSNSKPLVGAILDSDYVYEPGYGIYVANGIIKRIASSDELLQEYSNAEIIDLQGKAVIPGLVDSHTHLLWAGDRSKEVVWKQKGKTYRQIQDMGGGISHTVNATNQASDERIAELGLSRMKQALRNGTTHLETKSGYGLSTESELRLLKIADSINLLDNMPTLDLTWLGAHSSPSNMNYKEYTEEIISEQLPAVISQGVARSADVFCEPGWFTIEQSEDILTASRKLGLDLRIHIDEFTDGGGGDLASELRVTTADHAHYTNLESRENMSNNNVNTGFLPATPYSMGAEYPPFKDCIENNWKWTISTDFNPNCRTLSLPFVSSILVQRNDISPITALAACTVNSAHTSPHPSGLNHGSITEGSIANLNIVNSENWEAWCLQPGISPFAATMVNGNLIYH
jgi:imidazolonepropionase